MAEQPVVIALGACTIDTIMRVSELPVGDCKVLAEDAVQIASGMATSAACAAARLGAKATLIGRVGKDVLGQFFLDNLREANVDTHHVKKVPLAKTPLSAVIVDATGKRMAVPYYDKHLDDDAEWLPIPDVFQHTDGTRYKKCCVLVDPRWPLGAERLLLAARDFGIDAVFDGDVAPAEVLQKLAPLASHTVFSEKGFEIFSGEKSYNDEALVAAAVKLGNVVGVTFGSNGLFWAVGNSSRPPKVEHVPAPAVHAVDTLAAGDVFHGAYALALAEKQSVAFAAKFACTAAAIKCTRFGGRLGTPTRHEVDTYQQRRPSISENNEMGISRKRKL